MTPRAQHGGRNTPLPEKTQGWLWGFLFGIAAGLIVGLILYVKYG